MLCNQSQQAYHRQLYCGALHCRTPVPVYLPDLPAYDLWSIARWSNVKGSSIVETHELSPLLSVFNGNALIDTWAWTLVRTCPQYGIFFGFLDKRRLLGGNPHESKSYDQMANSHGAELELRLRAVSIAVPVFQAILLIE